MNVNDVRGRLALESPLQIEVRGRRPLPSPQTSTTGFTLKLTEVEPFLLVSLFSHMLDVTVFSLQLFEKKLACRLLFLTYIANNYIFFAETLRMNKNSIAYSKP